MTQHHPDIHLLTEFSAGAAPSGVALCIAAHIDFCPKCRNQLKTLDSLGGALFEKKDNLAPEEHQLTAAELDSSLDKTFAAIEQLENANVLDTVKPEMQQSNRSLPRCLSHLIPSGLDNLGWKKIGAALRVARLDTGDSQHEVALHQLHAGGGVADHDHRGQEITVVLKGSFSDQKGLYMPGDFLVRNAGEAHAPKASNDGDCICLSAMAAPVRFTGLLTRLINPFLKIYPSTI